MLGRRAALAARRRATARRRRRRRRRRFAARPAPRRTRAALWRHAGLRRGADGLRDLAREDPFPLARLIAALLPRARGEPRRPPAHRLPRHRSRARRPARRGRRRCARNVGMEHVGMTTPEAALPRGDGVARLGGGRGHRPPRRRPSLRPGRDLRGLLQRQPAVAARVDRPQLALPRRAERQRAASACTCCAPDRSRSRAPSPARATTSSPGSTGTGTTTCPRSDGVLAYLRCRRAENFEHYDHTILIGDIDGGALGSGEPLLYARRRMDWLLQHAAGERGAGDSQGGGHRPRPSGPLCRARARGLPGQNGKLVFFQADTGGVDPVGLAVADARGRNQTLRPLGPACGGEGEAAVPGPVRDRPGLVAGRRADRVRAGAAARDHAAGRRRPAPAPAAHAGQA